MVKLIEGMRYGRANLQLLSLSSTFSQYLTIMKGRNRPEADLPTFHCRIYRLSGEAAERPFAEYRRIRALRAKAVESAIQANITRDVDIATE